MKKGVQFAVDVIKGLRTLRRLFAKIRLMSEIAMFRQLWRLPTN